MVKRKVDDKAPPADKMEVEDEGDSGEDGDDTLDVDFEWFDPQPAVDFHGLKALLRQLLDVDNQLFDLSALADMILAQPLLGSTVKCDGNESDPFAFLTVLNLHQHRDAEALRPLRAYLLARAAASDRPAMAAQLQRLLDASEGEAQVGLILTERLINMPHQVVPPMYEMLLEEMRWANDEGEPYRFTHYLVVSKTYVEVASQLDAEDAPPAKKGKKSAAAAAETFYFHPEDEVLQKHAVASCGYDFAKPSDEGASDSKRTFQELGVKPQGHMILIEGAKFEAAVKALGQYLGHEA